MKVVMKEVDRSVVRSDAPVQAAVAGLTASGPNEPVFVRSNADCQERFGDPSEGKAFRNLPKRPVYLRAGRVPKRNKRRS